MKTFWRQFVILSALLVFSSLAANAELKLELTGFGTFNVNLGFPTGLWRASSLDTYALSFHKESKAFFFDSVLGQKNGLGFGGRAAWKFRPKLAFELGIECVLAGIQFKPEAIKALKEKMESIGYAPYFKVQESGGNILRFSGSLIYSIASGNTIPEP